MEEYVKQSRMIYTILWPNYLMDLWLGPGVDFDIANARVQIFGSGEGKINWVAREMYSSLPSMPWIIPQPTMPHLS